MRHYPEQRESILQEIILVLADLGKFKEALDELDLYLPSFPYQENPTLHIYAGLITLRLSKLANHTENKTLLIQARDHFTRTLALDQDNTIAKTFIEEINEELHSTEDSGDDNSEVEMEMDLDGDRSSKRARSHTDAQG
ncbi:rna polymerase i transcription factor subunit rrn11 [Pyrrhoderma noxium]|uniref:Rna polymerase i transcription factor subunit rrn11 n=1 Tax=Pyrrhoderma noxium TaxID=2282107 RepID=A0A286UNZ6_9AGAM|nr:rna polymerase i transcription factor subunit rrn11 [Pyrrhoderma noxium]